MLTTFPKSGTVQLGTFHASDGLLPAHGFLVKGRFRLGPFARREMSSGLTSAILRGVVQDFHTKFLSRCRELSCPRPLYHVHPFSAYFHTRNYIMAKHREDHDIVIANSRLYFENATLDRDAEPCHLSVEGCAVNTQQSRGLSFIVLGEGQSVNQDPSLCFEKDAS